jgi:hypothetical protein
MHCSVRLIFWPRLHVGPCKLDATAASPCDPFHPRGERLRQDPAKDQQRMLQVLPCWREYLKHRAAGSEGLDELRWLIEEWRVSLFAQELKTAEPVSAKRLAKALEAIA